MFHKYLIVAAFLATGLAGCVPVATNCTDIAISSASIDIQDELGEPIADADVRFRTADMAEQSCEEFAMPANYVCGFEVAGELIITIEAAGYEPTELTVTVEQDQCHVITEDRVVTLTPMAQPA